MNRILSKILVIGAGIAAAASVASCDLTTESPSNFNEMNLFSDPTLTEYQLYSVYNIFGGTNAQARLLQAEGVAVENGHVDLETYLWRG